MDTDAHAAAGPGSFTSDVLEIQVDGPIATLWLDRPEARNAMGPVFWLDLPRAMEALSEDPAIRAVVVAARGPHFSVGLDLKSMLGGPITGNIAGGATDDGSSDRGERPPSPAARAAASRPEIHRLQAAISSVAKCGKPVIAAVHGYCIGGGVDLIAACDIRLASADAVLSVREAKVAIVADLGSLQRLPKIIGAGHVAELAFTGKDISAHRAREIGLVNDVFADPAAVVTAAQDLAREIAANPPLAVQGTKAVLAAGDGRTVEEGLEYVATWNAGSLVSDDLMEAMAAFLEKRPPDYTGG